MTSPRSPSWRRAAGAALALALGSVLWTEPIPAVAAPPGQAADGVTYRLVDTWEDEPWQLTAGRFGTVSDVSSSPDGPTFVLDAERAGGGCPSYVIRSPLYRLLQDHFDRFAASTKTLTNTQPDAGARWLTT